MKKIIAGVVVFIAVASFVVAIVFFDNESSESPPLLTSPGANVMGGDGAAGGSAFVLPTFAEMSVSAPHTYDKSTYAFRGSSLIDIDGDGTDELWLAGGKGQRDTVLQYVNGVLEDISTSVGISQKNAVAAGAISIDIDADSDVDLIVTREDGVYMLSNEDGTFTEEKIDTTFAPDAIPFSVSAGDINKDGWVDLYISTFIAFDKFQSASFNNPANRSENKVLLNNGDNTFTDVTESSGLAFNQNTFQTAFADLDGDTWQDLIVAPNTDRVYIYKNNGDGTFEQMPALAEFGFWMGLAVEDYDNDGDQDFFVSNVGDTIPERVGRGDLQDGQVLDREWRFFRNDGNFQFADVAKEGGINDHKFGWGGMFGDINNDGEMDLAVAENYIKWPAHKLKKLPGSLFVQKDGMFHRQISALGVENSFYGTTPLFSDLNTDGHPEIIYVNMDSGVRVFKNSGTDNNYIRIAVPDSVEMIGSVITVTLPDGKTYSKQKIVGQGLMSDSSADMVFGIGQQTQVGKIDITLSSGVTSTIENPQINTRITLP